MALVLHSTANKNANKALIVAEYTGVKVELVKEFQMGVSNKTPEFLKMNPIGKVPVLETPDGPIFESNAIARYVARSTPDSPLYGSSLFEYGRIEQWMDFSATEIDAHIASWLYPRLGFRNYLPPVEEAAIANLKRGLGALNTHKTVIRRSFSKSPKMVDDLKPMDAEQLREYGHKMVDFIADYYKNIENFPVLSQVQPGYLRELLPDSAPIHPESLQNVLDDVETKILPGVTHWQSPDYFAYFPSNSSVAGFLGEMLSAGINMVGFSWITSPAATELETIVLDWLAEALKLPDEFLSTGNGGGVIQGTASEAVLVVLLAARDQVLRRVGKDSIGKLVAYSSDQTHSSLLKACKIGGIHPENCRILKTNSSSKYALPPESLSEAISQDIASGLIPFFLCATVGTTSSTAVDPLPALGKISKSNGLWFHVDAAYAGSACICPEYRHYLNGVEEANSFNMNAHKWFLTNFDCSALWVKDRRALIQSLSTNPEYLMNKASQENTVVDYKDWQIPLGRRFRSLKLWMVLRLYGMEKLQAYIRNHIELAKKFEELVKLDSRFEVVAPRTFSLVCFRVLANGINEERANSLNRELLEIVNSTGKLFISHTVLSNKYVLRFAVGAPLTEERHVVAAWKTLQEKASSLLKS